MRKHRIEVTLTCDSQGCQETFVHMSGPDVHPSQAENEAREAARQNGWYCSDEGPGYKCWIHKKEICPKCRKLQRQ